MFLLKNVRFAASFHPKLLWRRPKLVPFCSATSAPNNPKGHSIADGGRDLLHKIVDKHSAKNRTFIIPWEEDEAIDSMTFPFQQLISQGVSPEFLVDACFERENLFREMTTHGRNTCQMVVAFVEHFGMTFEDAIRLFSEWSDELANEAADTVRQRIAVFSGRGISSGTQLRNIIAKCPAILFTNDAQQMDLCLEQIANYFQAAQIKTLMLETPHICLLSPRELQGKYEYIYYHMGIESSELVESNNWMDLEIDQIMARHQFLSKTGKYLFPDPRKPQYKKENPKVDKIFDTSDQKFATTVAGVTHEEWLVFQQFWEQEKAMENNERPYERIKPSKRKAYERRVKKRRERAEGEIGGGGG